MRHFKLSLIRFLNTKIVLKEIILFQRIHTNNRKLWIILF
jgi:hypothetical protein